MQRPVRSLSAVFVLFILVIGAGNIVPGKAFGQEKTVSPESRELLGKLSVALAEVAAAVSESVVNISSTSTVMAEEGPYGDLFNDPFFRRFFGDQDLPKRKFKSQSLGSGVIVSGDGYILTNNHVIKDAEDIRVVLSDRRELKGRVVGSDPRTDLAVIKIEAKNLPAAKMGDSKKLKAGDVVIAIGTPFGLNQSITMGIVSAVGRSNVGIADLEDFIQTDAAVNPGNSGGALVNTSGEVVGINTAIFSTSGGYMGIGFAIPSDMVKTVMDSIIKHGRVIRGWLGVNIQNLTPELAKSLDIKEAAGVLVADVVKDSPAEKAGLKRGDVITHFDGKEVDDSTTLRNIVAATPPGKSVALKIIRDNKPKTIKTTLTEFKERKVAKKIEYNNVLRGITVQDLTPSIQDQLGLPPNTGGVIIADMAMDSPAQGVLQVSDVILEINKQGIGSVSEYDRVVSKIKETDTVLLLVYREGGTIYITIRP